MAIVGLKKPYYALYSNSGSNVSYSGGDVAGKYTKINLQLEEGDDNVFYADDGEAEEEPGFAGGTVTATTDDLRPAIAEVLLGLQREAIALSGLTTENPAWLDFDDNQNRPFVGLGGIITKRVGHETKFQAFAFPKIKFRNPNMEVTTRGKEIEWQVQDLVADISRSDAAGHKWYRMSTFLDTESDAEAIVKAFLGITDSAAPDPESNGGGG